MNEIFKTLGEELARQRQEKELSIAQLAVRTKIAEGFLEKMEQGDFGFLPPVYVRAFIRSVSAEIGLDPEVMMRRFSDEATRLSGAASGPAVERRTEPPADNSSFKPRPPHVPAADESRENKRADMEWFKSPFTLGIMLIALLALLYFAFSRKPAQEPSAMDSGIAVIEPVQENRSLRDAPLVPVTEDNRVDSTSVPQLSLTLRAEETAWVRIVYQDSLVEEGVFTEGLSRSWLSPERFYLKIGNAGGIRLILDGQDLGLTGEKGQVVTIAVSKDGIAPLDASQAPARLTQMNP
ncbi:MAG TPA: helix-turn-helix domain-containing protein [bacterium]|jgi:cytoskeletal protein RodZ|nr:helix-turn-helix domain-containing protein [bacterium]HOZ20184.1 helix-turn-helix domain-containing protein [bacterium]